MKAIVSVGLALAAALVIVTKATAVRSHVRELKEHFEHCKEMCSPGRQEADGACGGTPTPCPGAAG